MRALVAVVFAASRMLGSTGSCPAEVWDGTASVDARVADANCRLRDQVPGSAAENLARHYIVDVGSRGYLTAEASSQEFDTVLILTDGRFAQVAINDDDATGRTDSRMIASVVPGTYHLFVVSKRGTGAFSLRGTFDLGTGCQIRELPAGQIAGTLGGQSCRRLDAVLPSGIAVPTDFYSFKLDAPKVLSVLMQSRTVDSLLLLIDAKTGQVITGDDDGADGFANALLVTSVAPGEYLLGASVAGNAVGAYDLQAQLEDPRPCNTSDISTAGSASGQLVAGDCRLLDLFAPDDQENRLDLFRLTVPEPGVLTADATSNAFPTAIVLLDKDRKALQTALPQGASAASRMAVSVQPGEYFLGVTHTQLQAGNYQLRTSFDRLRACEPETLAPGAAAAGRLNSGECRFQDAVPASIDSTLAKPYSLTIENAGRLTVEMTSSEIDSFLWLLDAAGMVVAQDDNSAGGRNARIAVRLAPGKYTVIANTASTGSGGFEIKTVLEAPAQCPVTKLAAGETANGQLAENDCGTRDLMLANASAVPGRLHEIALAEPGVLTLDVCSFAFAPSVILVDAGGKRVASDVLDPRASAGGVHLRRDLPAGTYGVIVTATGGRAGDYSIRAAVAPPEKPQ